MMILTSTPPRATVFCSLLLVLLACCPAPVLAAWGRSDSETGKKAPPTTTAANTNAREKWMSGYVKMEAAMKAEKANNQVLALDLFQQARDIFNQVQDNYPDWNQSLLTYRIQFCTERIRRLTDIVEAQKETLTKPALIALSRKQSEEIQTLSKSIRDLNKQLGFTSEALERARREAARNAGAAERIEGLLTENKALRDRVEARETRLAEVAAEVARLQDTAGLKKVEEELRSKLVVAEARERELQDATTQYRDEINGMREQLQEATIERETLKAENRKLGKAAEKAAKQVREGEERVNSMARKLDQMEADFNNTRELLTRKTRENEDLQDEKDVIQVEVLHLRRFRDTYLEAKAEAQELQKKLTRAEGELAEARQRAEDAARKAAGIATTDLQDELAAARRELAVLRKTHQAQTEELNLAQERIGEFKQVRETLGEHEKARRAQETKIEHLQTELANRDERLERANQLVADRNLELARLQAQLENRDQKQAALSDEVKALATRKEDATEREQELAERVTEYEGFLKKVVTENDRLAKQSDNQLALLRGQEKEIQSLNRKLAVQQDRLATFSAIATGKQEAGGEKRKELEQTIATLHKKLEDVLTEREYARQTASDLDRQLKKNEQQLAEARQIIADAVGNEEAGAILRLHEQLRDMRAKLAAERNRAVELEAMLAQKPAVAPATPSTESLVQESTKALADTERRALIQGLLRKGMTAEEKGATEAAIWNYKQTLEFDPENKLALQRLGIVAVNQGDDKTAVEYLQQAFYQDPDAVDTLLPLGFALIRQRKPDLAISMLARAAALNQENPLIHRNLGVACSSVGWQDAAETQFRRALKLDETDSESAFNLAITLAAQKPPKMAEASQWYKHAREHGAAADPQLDQYFGFEAK
jgi:Tfp pilus assembly protein PilF